MEKTYQIRYNTKSKNHLTSWRLICDGEERFVEDVYITTETFTSKDWVKELKQYILPDNKVTEIRYPVTQYPSKIKSVKLERIPVLEGTLLGIKGQYLLFDGDRVFNIRSHEGFISEFSVQEIAQGTLF